MALHGQTNGAAQNFWSRLQSGGAGARGGLGQPQIGGAPGGPQGPGGGNEDLNNNGIPDRLEGIQGNLIDNKYSFDKQNLQLKKQQRYWQELQKQQQAQEQVRQTQATSPLGGDSLQAQPPVLQEYNLRGNAYNQLTGANNTRMVTPLNQQFSDIINGKATTGSGSSQPFGRLPTRATGSLKNQSSFSFGR